MLFQFISVLALGLTAFFSPLVWSMPCAPTTDSRDISAQVFVSGFGFDLSATRHLSDATAGLGKEGVSGLALKWAFDFKGAMRARSQPVITRKAIFLGSASGRVYALERQTGCILWEFQAADEVRTALSIGPGPKRQRALLYFSDVSANVYALDADTGVLVWQTEADPRYSAMGTGSPVLYGDKLIVPLSSWEVFYAMNPFYPCCKSSGSVVLLDAYTGQLLWQTRTINESPEQVGRNSFFIPIFAPSGATVWSTPSIDTKRQQIIIGTGQSLTKPVAKNADSIMALDLATGAVRWQRQMTPEDAYNLACEIGTANCPQQRGPDADFGASPILHTGANGKALILAGQKSGWVYALDPDKSGETVWQRKLGRGSETGGVHWGMASDEQRLYVPISDAWREARYAEPATPGIYALDIATGDTAWQITGEQPCDRDGKLTGRKCVPHYSANITVTDSLLIAADQESFLRIFDKSNGALLWYYYTDRDYDTVNGRVGNGGAIDAGGAIVADGEVFVNSGYATFTPGGGGNVFLVFSPGGK